MHSGRSGLSPPAGAVAAVPLWVLPTATSWHIGVLEQACWPSPELGRPGALAGFVFEAWWPSPGLGRLASLLGLFLGFGRVPGWGAWLFAARLFLLLGGRPLGRVPCWGAQPSCGRVRFSSGLWPSPELGRPCISCRVVFVLGFGRVPVWGARHFGPGSFFVQAIGRVPSWGARALSCRVRLFVLQATWPSPELGRPRTLMPGYFCLPWWLLFGLGGRGALCASLCLGRTGLRSRHGGGDRPCRREGRKAK